MQHKDHCNIPLSHPRAAYGIAATIPLYEGPLSIQRQDRSFEGDGVLAADFTASPRIRVEWSGSGPCPGDAVSELKICLPRDSNQAKALLSWSFDFTLPDLATAEGILSEPLDTHNGNSVGRVRFLILNLNSHGSETLSRSTDSGTESWRGRASFAMGHWLVTLDAAPNLDDLIHEARAVGRHAITHVGDLRRSDGKMFSPNDAENALLCLHWFLSFLNGGQCDCILPVGLRQTDTHHWESWGCRIVAPLAKRNNWFANAAGSECFAAASDFYTAWTDERRKEWLPLALSLYFSANTNTSGTESALTFSQIGLELLAWVALVEEQRILEPASFEKLNAADQMRLLLFWCGLPKEIPAQLAALRTAGVRSLGKAVADGPAIITCIRNSLVHPRREARARLSQLDSLLKFRAWQLGMWYFEVALLKLIGYAGPYSNRLGRERPMTAFDLLPWSVHRENTGG